MTTIEFFWCEACGRSSGAPRDDPFSRQYRLHCGCGDVPCRYGALVLRLCGPCYRSSSAVAFHEQLVGTLVRAGKLALCERCRRSGSVWSGGHGDASRLCPCAAIALHGLPGLGFLGNDAPGLIADYTCVNGGWRALHLLSQGLVPPGWIPAWWESGRFEFDW